MAIEDKASSRLIPITMAVLALAVLWFYWSVLAKLFVDLAENEDYSFGLLLPLVSGYIIYLKLPQIRCYFFQRRLWKILLLLMLLIPSAIVANAFRVMAMGIIPALLLPGFWHAFSGWLIFVFCLGILSLINWILNKLQPLSALPPDQFAPPYPAPRRG